jgi:ubiquinone/menaquinone biosynthesis C-methylase UbiE
MADRLDFTGERYVPWLPGQIRYEHLHRYMSVVQACTNVRVLDVACGEGYGSALLARHAADVIGVDIDEATVAHAAKTYVAPNLHFLHGTALALPVPEGSIDVVVSFETLEHFVEHDEFLAEVKRVLQPGGVFFVSSPNKLVYSDIPHFENHFHVRELYYDQLVTLARKNFRSVRIYGQQIAAVSHLRAMDAKGGETQILQADTPLLDAQPIPDPTYFIAVCSDGEPLPQLSSIFIDESDFLLNDMPWATAAGGSESSASRPLKVTTPEPIYVFGDSHSETFAMRCYDVGDRQFMFRPMYVPYAQAQFFKAPPNKLSRHLLGALTRAGLAVAVTPKEIGILHTTEDPHWRHIAVVRGIPHQDPTIVFAIGATDLLQFSREELAAIEEIVGDDEQATPTSIRFSDAVALFHRKMKPFEDALITLRSKGFSRLFVLSLVPITLNDAEFVGVAERLNLAQSEARHPTLRRSKFMQVANATLERIAAEANVPFIDRQIDLGRTGIATPGMLVDGIHLAATDRDRSAVAIINAVGRLPNQTEMPPRAQLYQVRLDAGSPDGLTELTVAKDSFASIQDQETGVFCRLRDVNTGAELWMNRARIVFVAPLD